MLDPTSWLWPSIRNELISHETGTRAKRHNNKMDDSLGCMFKLTGSNYSVWKSKMRDMLVVKDLWLSV